MTKIAKPTPLQAQILRQLAAGAYIEVSHVDFTMYLMVEDAPGSFVTDGCIRPATLRSMDKKGWTYNREITKAGRKAIEVK